MKCDTDAFNVYAKKDKRINQRTNEVNGIFSRIYIHPCARKILLEI